MTDTPTMLYLPDKHSDQGKKASKTSIDSYLLIFHPNFDSVHMIINCKICLVPIKKPEINILVIELKRYP